MWAALKRLEDCNQELAKMPHPLQDPSQHIRTQGVQRPPGASQKSLSAVFCPQRATEPPWWGVPLLQGLPAQAYLDWSLLEKWQRPPRTELQQGPN